MKSWKILILLVLTILVSCKKEESEPGPGESPLSPLAASSSQSAQDSPLQPAADERFAIDRPLVAGATEVSGQGPTNIPLQVVDVTSGGEILGSGTIGDDNRFSIKLGAPVPANHVIGIQLATAKDPDTWIDLWALRSKDARAIPQIGEFFDTVISSSE